MPAIPIASTETKINILSNAINDVQDQLRFAESKAGFVAVVMTIAVTGLPALPDVKDLIGFRAIKSSLSLFASKGTRPTVPLDSLMLLIPQLGIFIALILCLTAVIICIRAAVPIDNPRSHLIDDGLSSTGRYFPMLFHPTGLSRKLKTSELLSSVRKDIRFNFSRVNQQQLLLNITDEELCSTIGDQVIVLSLIRDIKMIRVTRALRLIIWAICIMVTMIFVLALRYLIYGEI